MRRAGKTRAIQTHRNFARQVSVYSSWEKELAKIVFDPRYLLLTSRERKSVFEKYVKERAEQERQEKRNRLKERRDAYVRLLEDAKLDGKSTFSEFSARFAKDDTFKAIEKARERESIFDEFILDVRRREKDAKVAKDKQVSRLNIELLALFSPGKLHSSALRLWSWVAKFSESGMPSKVELFWWKIR